MATKPLKTITFEGLEDTYTIPQVDDTLSVTGASADAKVTGDSLKAKAEAEGMVSMAKALVGGKYTLDQSPYHYRQSPDAGALDEKIVGGTLGWNQLVQNGDFSDGTIGWKAQNAGSSVSANNGIMSVTFNSGNANAYNPALSYEIQSSSFVANHAYLISYNIKAPITSHVYLGNYAQSINTPSTQTNTWVAHKFMMKPTELNSSGKLFNYIGLSDPSSLSVGDKLEFQNIHITDLTTLFGSTIADYIYSLEQATAGAGVAWVRQYIDLDTHHEYCEPTLKSVEGLQSRDVVGFNQWDEEWEVGIFNVNTGEKYANNNAIRTKNRIAVFPSTTYYAKTPRQIYKFFYDSNGDYISGGGSSSQNATFTTPSNAHYMNFYVTSGYGTTYNNDICINLSDPSRNGQYEPYEKHSYPLDSDVVLRGVPKLVTDHIEFDGDKYRSDGTVERRYGVVVLDGTQNNFGVSAVNDFAQVSWNGYNNIGVSKAIFVSDKFTYADLASGAEGRIYPSNSASRMFLGLPSTVTTAAQAQAWFASNPTTVIYPLATPTTETAQPYQSPQLVGSTEEYVTTGVVPVGHESRYYEDITGKVNNLPSDFSTLIAPVEKSFTATRNYTVGSFVIVNNQLYKVSSAISSGWTITPNSNVTATTIMAEILALA